MVPPNVATLLDRLGPSLAQLPRRNGIELAVSTGIEFVLSVAVIGLIGAVVHSAAPEFTTGGVGYLHEEPAEALLYGLGATVLTVVAAVLLAITVVGLIVLVPALIALAILGFGATTVSVIALGSWLRSALGGGAATEYGTALLIGAVAWAALNVVPILGSFVTFVIGTMGYGYLALWLLNGRFDRDYGSYGGPGADGTTREAHDRSDPERGHTNAADRARGGNERPIEAEDGPDDDSDRFRNLAAMDAEREAESDESADDESTGDADTTSGTGDEETSAH